MINWRVAIDFPGISLRSEGQVTGGTMLGIHGPSGSGKSTLLRIMAGLEPRATGMIEVSRQHWLAPDADPLPPHRRRCALVAQRPIFFDHLDAMGNLQFGRQRRKLPADPRLLEYLVDVLHLTALLDTGVGRMSGGELQRLAIARALYSGPEVLLLDEPLTGLDDERKERISTCLRRLQQELGVPTLFVSHHISEHGWLSDSMTFVENGVFQPPGPVHEALRAHGMNVFDGRSLPGNRIRLEPDGAELKVRPGSRDLPADHRVRIAIPAAQIMAGNDLPEGFADNEFQVQAGGERGADVVVRSDGLALVVPGNGMPERVAFNVYPENFRLL